MDWHDADRLVASLDDTAVAEAKLTQLLFLIAGIDEADVAMLKTKIGTDDLRWAKRQFARAAGDRIIAMTETMHRGHETDATFYWQFCLDCPSPYYRYQVWKNMLPHE